MAKRTNQQPGPATAVPPPGPNLQQQQEEAQKRREEQERAAAEAKAKADADAAKAAKQSKTEAARKAAKKKADALLAAFAGDPPHEAEDGCYSFNQRDRWHGTKPGLLDGWHHGSGWAIRIKGGHPVEAIREDHPAYPKHSKRAA